MLPILPTVLHVEDDPNDRLFLKEAFRQANLSARLEAASDGQVAIQYLSGAEAFADRSRYPVPGLVLLDLKMPRTSGFEVLEWIRRQPAFQSLPVVVFTSSRNDADMRRSYQKGANSYVLKPMVFEELVAALKAIHHYWFSLNQTPSPE